jgi:hypothetical protein
MKNKLPLPPPRVGRGSAAMDISAVELKNDNLQTNKS